MRFQAHKDTSSGFSVVEVALLVAVVAIIGTIGYLFYQNNIAKKPADTASKSVTAPAGTTASIDQQTQQDAATEGAIDSNADSQAVDNVISANSTVSNVGGAYDENSF